LFWKVFVVRTVFQVCAVEKGFPIIYITAGVKISWRQVRNGSWEIQPEKPGVPEAWHEGKGENEPARMQLLCALT